MDGKAVQLFGAEILSCGCFLLTLLMKLVSSELLVSVCADVLVLCCVSGNVCVLLATNLKLDKADDRDLALFAYL